MTRRTLSTQYVKWLRVSVRNTHAVAKTNLKKTAKHQKRGYGETKLTICFQRGDWVWHVYR